MECTEIYDFRDKLYACQNQLYRPLFSTVSKTASGLNIVMLIVN